jgi:Sigma-70, region 4
MATFDQLPAEQRAILELVVGRGQTYDELSGMLGMPASRVRELARDALAELAPATAARVDSDWRGQIADYVLGQQTGPEATATRGHLKRSEAARAWAYSLLDSLGHLYSGGTLPEIPDADDSAAAPPDKAKPEPEEPAPAREPAAPRPRQSGGVSLSPAAQAVVRKRRIIGGAIGLAVVVVVVLLVAGVFSGGGGKKDKTSTAAQSNATAYEVWLYNSSSDASPLGAQFTDAQGNLQGRGALPKNWRHFKSVLLSRERVGSNPKTPANVVLKATLTDVPASSQQTKNGVKIISEGVLKPSKGETGTGIAVVLVQSGQDQLVVQAARLKQTTRVLAPATGSTGATGTGTTPTPTGTTGG